MSIYTKIIDLQKLQSAWLRVKRNKPAAGVDNISFDQFDEMAKEEIKTLNKELVEHSYKSLPVKLVNLYKGEKVRTIALYSMRDKVVQQSLANELTQIFDRLFSCQTYAYRNNKSAIIAVEELSTAIAERGYSVFVKLDISSFFDSIRWNVLRGKLEQEIKEEDVMDLIKECSCSLSLDEITGELEQKRCGIYQGSAIAPILSNVYLMDFDIWLSGMKEVFFIRYSDDMILLCNDYDIATSLLQEIKNRFDVVGLKLNEKKSSLGTIDEGFDFLGYHFDAQGKSIPAKAESNLYDRLEIMWLTSGDIGIEDKLRKVLEIVGGWEQYFRGEREIGSIFEIAALAYSKGGSDDGRKEILKYRSTVQNIYKDIAEYLANIWRTNKLWEAELAEYEEFYKIPVLTQIYPEQREQVKLVDELLHGYRHFIIREDYETAIEIMQSYTDLRLYSQAEYWQNKAEELNNTMNRTFDVVVDISKSVDDIIYKSDSAAKILKLFIGREDLFAHDEVDGNGIRKVIPDLRPLTEQTLREHLQGKTTVNTYVQRSNGTVRYLVCDVDISKHILLRIGEGSDEYSTYMQKALDVSLKIKGYYAKMGMPSYIEFSGKRGYHVWLFFTEWIPTRYANMLSEILENEIGTAEDISLEFFPNKTRLKAGKYGQALKVPYGIHGKSGKRSYFIDDAGEPILNVNTAVDAIGKVALSDIKKVIAANTSRAEVEKSTDVDDDISPFGEIPSLVSEVLLKCNLVRYLCLKAVKTNYLNHFERLTVLYVFGHLGTEGKEFVHKVMSFTLNYKFNVTENFIRKMPEKPISCVKLRDQYKQLTAEFGCSCNFKRNKNCYPSPVLHAISLTDDIQSEITLPTSRTLSKEKEGQLKAEMNIHSKAQELASRILEFKKQKRSIDKSICRLEKELEGIFESQKINEIEIDMGVIRRRKTEAGIEWFIEI